MRKAPLVPLALVIIAVIALFGRPTPYAWQSLAGSDGRAAMLVRIAESPSSAPRSVRAVADVLSVGGTTSSGRVYLYLRPDSLSRSLRYADCLYLPSARIDTLCHSIYLTPNRYTIVSRDSTSLRARCERVRHSLLARLYSGPLPHSRASLAAALVLGDKGGLPSSTRSAFRDAGIAHLLAVSGLHVGIVSALVGGLLHVFGRGRRQRIVSGIIRIVVVWLFVLITGCAPSAVRAALMFSLFIVADIAGRRTPKLNLLAASAIVTLLVSPSLLFDLGWQLSYAAVAGILLARPVIVAFRNRIYQTAILSLAATTATLPITLVAFHRFTPYFLLANVLVVPLAGLLMCLAALYTAFPSDITAWPLNLLFGLVEHFVLWISSLPGAVVQW